MENIRFDKTVSYVLAKVTTAFRTSLERTMSPIRLHGGQVFILLELWKRDGRRQVDLAAELDLSTPTVNKTVNGLVDKGLVTRTRLQDDARSTRIFLTERGTSIRAEVEAQWLELEENCLLGLTETERLVLFDLLSKLRNRYTGREATEDE